MPTTVATDARGEMQTVSAAPVQRAGSTGSLEILHSLDRARQLPSASPDHQHTRSRMFDDHFELEAASAGIDGEVSTVAAEKIDPPTVKRDRYGAISSLGCATALLNIHRHFASALPEAYAAFDHVQRGDAVNHDLYGYDAGRDLAVVQVRHYFRQYRNGFANTRKTYFLVGFTETGAPFRHPVSAHTIRAAVRRGERSYAGDGRRGTLGSAVSTVNRMDHGGVNHEHHVALDARHR